MRAAWISDLTERESYSIAGDIHHHLVHVVRISVGDDLLLLNGLGLAIKTQVEAITKKAIILKHLETLESKRGISFDIVIGVPKKEALELCLKEATEIGVRKIFLIRGDYSQVKVPEDDRILKILVSALEQSNSPFLPEVIVSEWETIPWNDYACKLLMDSQTLNPTQNKQTPDSTLLIIGPEGGFSPKELSYLHAREGLEVLKLPTPILRTPTALAVGAGIILERLMD